MAQLPLRLHPVSTGCHAVKNVPSAWEPSSTPPGWQDLPNQTEGPEVIQEEKEEEKRPSFRTVTRCCLLAVKGTY